MKISKTPTGHKQTAVGIIPEGWEERRLVEIGKFKNGINKDSSAFGHGYPFVNLMDVFGFSSIETSKHLGLVQSTESELQMYDLKKGDVLFIRSSVKPSGVGLTAVITKDLPETVYSGFLIRFRDNNKLETNYKRHCFYASNFRNSLIATSSVSANTNINQESLKKLFLTYPSDKKEQAAIANTLDQMDNLIAKLNKLIQKKRHIKQGAMQELLTGKRRLPGFSGEWENKRLGDIADVVGGGTPSSAIPGYWNGTINWFTPTEVGYSKYLNESCRKISEEGQKNSSAKLLPPSTILLTSRAGIGDVGILKSYACTNQGFQSLIPSRACDSEFLYYLLQTKKTVLLEKANGSTFLEISPNSVRSIEVEIPKTEEQIAIAQVLSDMDTEIESLEKQKAKYIDLKQGMMQQLLTGKIRLVKPESESKDPKNDK